MIPPIVYIIPPAKSQPNAAPLSVSKSCVNAITQTHPIAIYNREENHFGQVIQQALIIMPPTAIPQTNTRRGMPIEESSTIKHTGVYVPAIKTNIIIWSIFLNSLSPFSESFKEW